MKNFQLLSFSSPQTNLCDFLRSTDRSEMHRHKLSPRGKLYLKTDAEGKHKKIVDKKLLCECSFFRYRCICSFVSLTRRYILFSPQFIFKLHSNKLNSNLHQFMLRQ